MSIPKISTVHPGFAGTFTHMDGNDEKEKERKKHLWKATNILDSHDKTTLKAMQSKTGICFGTKTEGFSVKKA